MTKKHYPNRLGILGWLGGGRWGLERYLFLLHRITGLGILTYFLAHIFVTSARAWGKESWVNTMAGLNKPIFLLGEYLVFLAFAIHGINGIRLILLELGWGLGKPTEPVYPYQTSVHKQRPWVWATMALAGIMALLGAWELWQTH